MRWSCGCQEHFQYIQDLLSHYAMPRGVRRCKSRICGFVILSQYPFSLLIWMCRFLRRTYFHCLASKTLSTDTSTLLPLMTFMGLSIACSTLTRSTTVFLRKVKMKKLSRHSVQLWGSSMLGVSLSLNIEYFLGYGEIELCDCKQGNEFGTMWVKKDVLEPAITFISSSTL